MYQAADTRIISDLQNVYKDGKHKAAISYLNS